jgi:hypothetical protein
VSLQDFANLGEAISGIAVLITLIFLTLQLRRTRLDLSRQNGRELLRQLSEIALKLSENPRLLEIHVKAQSEFDALSEADRLAWVNFLVAWLNCWDSGIHDRRRGHLAGIDVRAYAEGFALILRSPGGRRVWPIAKPFLDPESVQILEEKIAESTETQLERFARRL